MASLLLFWIITHGSVSAVLAWGILPNLYLLGLIVAFVLPLQFSRSGRFRFLATLRRISIGGIAEAQDGKFGDILLADVLTSYSKVLGDLFVALCMLFTPGTSSTAKPDRSCGGTYVVPILIAIPSVIRLRQCLIEYLRVRRNNKKAGEVGAHGWGGQHLANALKYATAFPVIILSAMQRDYDASHYGMTETGLFRLWCDLRLCSFHFHDKLTGSRLLFVFVNSFYSFYWDVAKDWDLTLFSSSRERNDPEHPFGLRRNRYFHVHEIYYSVIVVDLMLRCTWSFKLSPHLDHFNDLEGSIFLMELLEVFRRWLWMFFRVETEWGERGSQLAVSCLC